METESQGTQLLLCQSINQSITFFQTLLRILRVVTHLNELVDLSRLGLLVASYLDTLSGCLIV